MFCLPKQLVREAFGPSSPYPVTNLLSVPFFFLRKNNKTSFLLRKNFVFSETDSFAVQDRRSWNETEKGGPIQNQRFLNWNWVDASPLRRKPFKNSRF
jgi:hypothetical protein